MKLALFGHLVAFATGFGAVIVMDVVGALWVLGKVPKRLMTQLGSVAQVIIWLSVGALSISGVVLLAGYVSSLMVIKLGAVATLIINGVLLHRLNKAIDRSDVEKFIELARSMQAYSVVLILISQIMWWTAIVIGFRLSVGGLF